MDMTIPPLKNSLFYGEMKKLGLLGFCKLTGTDNLLQGTILYW